MNWYQYTLEELKSKISSDLEAGLSASEAENRLKEYGHKELEEGAGKSFYKKLMEQFSDFLVLILIAAAVVSIFIGEKTDSIVILAIVVVNAFLGIYQEGKAEKALAALKEMASPNAKVIRDGHLEIIPAKDLVPGDLVSLEAGDIIPADLRLIETSNLKVEEASLTGESVPVDRIQKLSLRKMYLWGTG